mgnify:CR=1 FL=1
MTDILFVLPVGGGSGGAHSVMQECSAMRRMGVDARIAVNEANSTRLAHAYRDMAGIGCAIHSYNGIDGLGALIDEANPRTVVATTNQSVHHLAAALQQQGLSSVRTAYYIQDYEPFFYQRNSDDWIAAHRSYGLLPGMIHFAKTAWLQEVVRNNHWVDVYKVEASIDHDVFYPDLSRALFDAHVIQVAAMVRPSTPRRAPRRTVQALNRLARAHPGRLVCTAFGCSEDELRANSLILEDVAHIGILERREMGELFRQSDIFLDLSDFQAFGRSALEAMSCGTIAVVPVHGGAGEYAIDGVNALMVDTRSDEAIDAAVTGMLGMTVQERHMIRLNGAETGQRYSCERAALSEIRLLLDK